MEVLRGVERYGAVPVTGTAHDAGFFAKTGDAQLQWIAEAVDAQLSSLLEGLSRLFQQLGTSVRFGAHGKQRTT
ncbi:hypothetical protein D3C84_840500 [compost metagenome]